MFVEEFKISHLFGYKDVEITFAHPILILIGENGFGKTTILNALNYTLQGCYKELLDIKFDSIEIKVEGRLYGFSYAQLVEYNEYTHSDSDRHSLTEFLKNQLNPSEFETLCTLVSENRSQIRDIIGNQVLKQLPDEVVFQEIKNYLDRENRFGVFRSLKAHIESFNYNILFKPTYRRVEADLNATFGRERRMGGRTVVEIDEDQQQNYAAKIIRFGMKDVQRMIARITDTIKMSSLQGFAKVSSDMIRHLLDDKTDAKTDLDLDIDSLRIILGRTGDNLSDAEKEKFIRQIENKKRQSNPYLIYFLEQLYNVYKRQEVFDTAIKKFRDVCNGYLKEKQFVYDESQVNLKIYRKPNGQPIALKEENVVDLNNLSSGEKQIVSLFAQIYLDVDKKFVMLLDEPELSLSIYWQEKLLSDIYESGRCVFMLAVTHSPFIFRKSMSEYVVGLQEFQKNRN